MRYWSVENNIIMMVENNTRTIWLRWMRTIYLWWMRTIQLWWMRTIYLWWAAGKPGFSHFLLKAKQSGDGCRTWCGLATISTLLNSDPGRFPPRVCTLGHFFTWDQGGKHCRLLAVGSGAGVVEEWKEGKWVKVPFQSSILPWKCV